MQALIPQSSTALAICSTLKYISMKAVQPLFSISRHASFVPAYMCSGFSFFSRGHIFFSSHSISGMSSAYPLKRVIAACVCAFTKPGTAARFLPSITTSDLSLSTSPTPANTPSSTSISPLNALQEPERINTFLIKTLTITTPNKGFSYVRGFSQPR